MNSQISQRQTKYYVSVIKNYATFKGRARRKEFWMFTLFNIVFFIIAALADNMVGDTFRNPINGLSMGYGYIYCLYGAFALTPAIAVGVRRLHDVGKSGALMMIVMIVSLAGVGLIAGGQNSIGLVALIGLVQLVGGIWLLVLMCKDSATGPNKYGPNPKGIGNDDQFDFMSMPDSNS